MVAEEVRAGVYVHFVVATTSAAHEAAYKAEKKAEEDAIKAVCPNRQFADPKFDRDVYRRNRLMGGALRARRDDDDDGDDDGGGGGEVARTIWTRNRRLEGIGEANVEAMNLAPNQEGHAFELATIMAERRLNHCELG